MADLNCFKVAIITIWLAVVAITTNVTNYWFIFDTQVIVNYTRAHHIFFWAVIVCITVFCAVTWYENSENNRS